MELNERLFGAPCWEVMPVTTLVQALAVALLVFINRPSTAAAESPPPGRETVGGTPVAPSKSVSSPRAVVSTAFGTSYQVNVNPSGQNIVGDAANEPSLCIDPTNPN